MVPSAASFYYTYPAFATRAVSALEFICDRYGFDVLDRTLRLSLGTWEGDSLSLTSSMLKGIALIVNAYGSSLDDELFKERIGRSATRAIYRLAKDRRPGAMGFAEALLITYNGKSKRKLSMQKLYWSSSKKRKGEAPPDFDQE